MRGIEQLMSSARTGTGKDDWRTPENVLEFVRKVRRVGLDPCASPNPTHWFAEVNLTQDGLTVPWRSTRGSLVYVNPPYSACREWLAKCANEQRNTIALVPARTDTRAWHESVFASAHAICFWKGRLRFVGAPSSAPFPSAVIYWGQWPEKFEAAFMDAGMVVFL